MAQTSPTRPFRKIKRRKKGSGTGNYFTQHTEDSIIAFQNEEDLSTRKQIFVEHIRPAFVKLIENLIFVYNFHTLGNTDVLKNDCMSFLFESLRKFDASKGSKAFSYFNVIARNWLIQRVKVHKKKKEKSVSFDNTVLADLERNNHQAVVSSFEDGLMDREFLELLKKEIKSWRTKFDKPQEKTVLEAIIVLLENPDLVPLYNKKGIYMYLREITGMNTKQVVTNLTKFRKKYQHVRKKYLAGEI